MRKRFLAIVAVGLSSAMPVNALENQTVLWKDIGPWTIRVVEEGNGFCEATAYWPGGTHVTLGFSANRRTPRMVVSNPEWQTGNREKGYDLIVQFGSQMPWRVPSLPASQSDTGLDLRIEARDLLFFEDIMGAQQFGVRFGDQSVVQFDMGASFDALLELGSCQTNVAGDRSARELGAS